MIDIKLRDTLILLAILVACAAVGIASAGV